jgi:hypothetical protein
MAEVGIPKNFLRSAVFERADHRLARSAFAATALLVASRNGEARRAGGGRQ